MSTSEEMKMMQQKSLIRTLVLLTVLGLALSMAPKADSLPTGINGFSEKGCTCHGAVPDPGVTPLIEGLPASFNASTTYTLTISFSGGPSGTSAAPENLGGFNLAVDSGTLVNIGEDVQIWGSNEAGHTELGNDQTSWNVDWTSPASGSATFTLATNSVNGDGGASPDDKWNMMSMTVQAPSAGAAAEELQSADPFVVLITLIIVSGILLASVILYTFYRVSPGGFNWESFSPWIVEWLTSTDHKKVGTLYFIAGFFFLGVGGVMALLIRIQLSVPGNDFLTQDQYNSFFTMHGTTRFS